MLELRASPDGESIPADFDAPQPSATWVQLIGPPSSISAIACLGFAYAALLLSRLQIVGKDRDLALFIFAVLLLPPICAALQAFSARPDFRKAHVGLIETIHCWLAVVLLLTLATLPVIMFAVGTTGDFWPRAASIVVATIAGLHAVGLAVAAVLTIARRRRPVIAGISGSRAVQTAALMLAFFAALFALFWIDPSNRELNLFIRLFFEPPFSDEPGHFPLLGAIALASLGMAALIVLFRIEARSGERNSKMLQAAGLVAICTAPMVTAAFFFDYSLMHDALHYMTIVGPALHVLHGGTLMVDTFSQYGPGPVLVTIAGFLIGPIRFGTIQITVQLFNLMFYAVWLVCLYRMSRWKLSALLLGLFSIALFHAAWGRGFGNVNEAPSILGPRHLPILLMVLALSCLHPPRQRSAFTAIAAFVSGLWSAETLIGALAVHFSVLGLLGLRDRAFRRLAVDIAIATLPAAAGVAAMALATLLQSGRLPDYPIYLQYLSAYSMVSAYWSIPASPMFFGWATMLLAVILVFGDAWLRVFDRRERATGADDELLFYRFVPMTTLLALQASYFAGRSVDFTLVMALLPFCALAIPGGLATIAALNSGNGAIRLLSAAPIAVGAWALAFSCLSLFRQHSQYSLWLHECRDFDRCTPQALGQELQKTIRERTVLEPVRKPDPDGWFDDKGIVRDAVRMLAELAGREDAVTVLLGRLHGDLDLSASELSLMYAGKWDRWPRSYTLSDALVSSLAQRIIVAPISLRQGELVLVRRDESRLGFIEAGILKRIRAQAVLCAVDDPSPEVVAYRVAGPAGCVPG
jgi:hypothetical protein